MWFRFHCSTIDDFDFNAMPEPMQIRLVKLWAVYKRHRGEMPEPEEIAFELRMGLDEITLTIDFLSEKGFLVETNSGLAPKNWNQHQFTSDDSTERVKKYRKIQRNQKDKVKREEPLHTPLHGRYSNGAVTPSEQNRTDIQNRTEHPPTPLAGGGVCDPDSSWTTAGFKSAEHGEEWWSGIWANHPNRNKRGGARALWQELVIVGRFNLADFQTWYSRKVPAWEREPKFAPNLDTVFRDELWRGDDGEESVPMGAAERKALEILAEENGNANH